MAYETRFRLSIRDKKDWRKWSHSEEFKTIEACFTKYKAWLASHPSAVISFTQTKVLVPDPQ